MAAEKRNFDNFENFPGDVNDGTGYHEFPAIISVDSSDRKRVWNIYVRLIKSDNKRLIGIDWNLLEEKQIPIKTKYYGHGESYVDIPNGTIAQVWTSTGLITGKITRNSPTYFESTAHDGQINQRNQLHNALIYARSQYLKYHEKHCSRKAKCKSKNKSNNVMYFPMLATTEEKGVKHLKFPVIGQPKLDGARAVTFLRSKDGGAKNVVIYTRTKKSYPDLWYLQVLLYPYLNDLYDTELNQSIYLDGELYKHGKALQDISGSVRRSKENRLSKRDSNAAKTQSDSITLREANEYHIYDCFYPLELDTAYESRREQLQNLFDSLSNEISEEFGFAVLDVVKPVPDWELKSLEAAKVLFDKLVKKGYEGLIIRNVDAIYTAGLISTSGTRSKNLVKMKQRFTEEFECIGYTQGKRGKDLGAIIWIIKTSKNEKLNVTPKDTTYKKRYELYKDCLINFDKKYLGRMLTVEYEDLSKAGKPLRAKALLFRDYE